MKNKSKGFTLIELLVVIAIIGILSTLSVVALNSARARARDAKRISDIRQVQTALEMYHSENNDYPPTPTSVGLPAELASGTTPLLNSLPKAPLPADSACSSANTYVYTYTNQGSYTLKYCLGSATGGIAAGVQTATPAGIGSLIP
ncbi:MAG: prepilin-type N-terminal cleavage/methylation domain-containing protein [Clostridia bacterium]|nr:prepilin-type N-terminal cleavage/methylation domain-containing protein [Clostridia bacterium]